MLSAIYGNVLPVYNVDWENFWSRKILDSLWFCKYQVDLSFSSQILRLYRSHWQINKLNKVHNRSSILCSSNIDPCLVHWVWFTGKVHCHTFGVFEYWKEYYNGQILRLGMCIGILYQVHSQALKVEASFLIRSHGWEIQTCGFSLRLVRCKICTKHWRFFSCNNILYKPSNFFLIV